MASTQWYQPNWKKHAGSLLQSWSRDYAVDMPEELCSCLSTEVVGLLTPWILNIWKNSQGVKSQGVKSRKEKRQETIQNLISYCKEPRTLQDISEYLGYSDKYRMKRIYIDPLLDEVLIMTSAESKTDPKQKYVVKKKLVWSYASTNPHCSLNLVE